MKKLITKIIYRLNFLKHINITVKNKKFLIPILDGVGYENILKTEKWMDSILTLLTKSFAVSFVDVGVNIEQTLLKLKNINQSTPYVGFEPNPVCSAYVQRLIKKNKLEATTLIPAGVSNQNAILTLTRFLDNADDNSASIIENFRPKKKVVFKQHVVVVDKNHLQVVENPAIVKIDVEGVVLEVVQSFQEIFEKYHPIVMMEILPVYSAENKERLERQKKIESILAKLDYSTFRIQKGPGKTLAGLQQIQEIEIHDDLAKSDYIFTPNNKQKKLLTTFEDHNFQINKTR